MLCVGGWTFWGQQDSGQQDNLAKVVSAMPNPIAIGKEWQRFISIHRATEPHRFYLYAVTVQQRLPRIFIPLAPDDPKVAVLDLQAVIDRCYEAGAYDDVIDYSQEPPPLSFSPEVMSWIDTLLKEKGHRK